MSVVTRGVFWTLTRGVFWRIRGGPPRRRCRGGGRATVELGDSWNRGNDNPHDFIFGRIRSSKVTREGWEQESFSRWCAHSRRFAFIGWVLKS